MKIISSKEIPESFYSNSSLEDVGYIKKIVQDVKIKGDRAVRYYTKLFDNVPVGSLEVSKKKIKEAYKKVPKEFIESIKAAAKRIKFFAEAQKEMYKEFEIINKGVVLGQKIIAIEKVGCYVPGGNYPLPSTALMTVIPAKVAGARNIIVCSPKIRPATIVAADIAGADRIYSIGGAQAIAAMAYGTKSVPKVDIIVGPGNKYVTSAKKLVFGTVGIDMLAGPSEVMIIADEEADPEIVASDLLAQAEHDISACCVLLTPSYKLAELVEIEVRKQLKSLRTKDIAKESIKNGWIILVKNIGEAIIIANKKAPEHLELQVRYPERYVSRLKSFGSLFIGKETAEVFGDYCSGANHTLPTSGNARFASGLSVGNFLRIATYQKTLKEGLGKMIATASKIAEIEGLDAHKKAAEMRIK